MCEHNAILASGTIEYTDYAKFKNRIKQTLAIGRLYRINRDCDWMMIGTECFYYEGFTSSKISKRPIMHRRTKILYSKLK